jgi:hypothetical protein
MWQILQASDDTWHVLPLGDLCEHQSSPSCWCGPTLDEGLHVHHALDRREEAEPGGARQ